MKKNWDSMQEKNIIERIRPNDIVSYKIGDVNSSSTIVKVKKHFWTKYLDIKFKLENGSEIFGRDIYSCHQVPYYGE